MERIISLKINYVAYVLSNIGAPENDCTNVTNVCKSQIPLHYPGRRPVASWNLAYHALSRSLAAR